MQLEEMQRALARVVVWMRSESVCPIHEWIEVAALTQEGVAIWNGPACEVEDGLLVDCEWREHKKEILNDLIETLGTADMTNFLP